MRILELHRRRFIHVPPPTAPTQPVVSPFNETISDLSWEASTGLATPIVYEIELGGETIATVSEPSYRFSGITPGTCIAPRIRAKDANGQYSPWSEPIYICPDMLVARTKSSSSAWAFDRWRLYNPTDRTMVKVVLPDGSVQEQRFSQTNGFEHDFLFDLSSNTQNEEVKMYIRGIPAGANFTQLYSYPTGYGATRGKNAQLTYWNYSKCNPSDFLRLENQGLPDGGFPLDAAVPIKASTIYLQNNQFSSYWLGLILDRIDASGKTNGELNYSGNPGEASIGSGYRVYYDSLIAKGWTITGIPPY